MTTDVKDKEEIETKQTNKRTFVKPFTGKKLEKAQPNDVSSTVRFPKELRELIASYCYEYKITMNSFILEAVKEKIVRDREKKQLINYKK